MGEAVAVVEPTTAVSVVAAAKAKRTISRDKRGTRTANRVANSRPEVAGRSDVLGHDPPRDPLRNRATCLGWGDRSGLEAVTEAPRAAGCTRPGRSKPRTRSDPAPDSASRQESQASRSDRP